MTQWEESPGPSHGEACVVKYIVEHDPRWMDHRLVMLIDFLPWFIRCCGCTNWSTITMLVAGVFFVREKGMALYDLISWDMCLFCDCLVHIIWKYMEVLNPSGRAVQYAHQIVIWFKYWFVFGSAKSHCLNQWWWIIVIWTLGTISVKFESKCKNFDFKNMNLNMVSVRRQPFC